MLSIENFVDMASSFEEKSKDLSTCCVCMETYNEGERKPKYLHCHHTFCLQCLVVMIHQTGANRVSCPVCKRMCKAIRSADTLMTNVYALHMALLKNRTNNGQCWCVQCDKIAKSVCLQEKHSTISFMDDAQDIEVQLIDVSTQLVSAAEQREEIQEHLQGKQEKLRSDLTKVEAEMENNDACLKKLRDTIACFQEMSRLSHANKAARFVREKLKKTKEDIKGEVERALQLKNQIMPLEAEDSSCVAKSKQTKGPSTAADVTVGTINNWFAANCFSSYWEDIDATHLFQCKDLLTFPSGPYISSIEFSDDGKFLVTETGEGGILLRPTLVDRSYSPLSIELEGRYNLGIGIGSLAVSLDGSRIFTGDGSTADEIEFFPPDSDDLLHLFDVMIHDSQTYKLLHSVRQPDGILDIALNPETKNGDIFAAACFNGALRIFDLRRNTTEPVTEAAYNPSVPLRSVMFSPANSALLCVSSSDGARIYDTRNLSRWLHSFSSPWGLGTHSVLYNHMGNRLLFLHSKEVLVYDLSVHGLPVETGKVCLTAPGFENLAHFKRGCCFAGANDELVVAGSDDGNLYVWALPEVRGDQTINQPLAILRGHAAVINSVRYSRKNCTLISCDSEAFVKLWTPVV